MNARQNDSTSAATLLFSVNIAVYNDWAPLDQCLRSLANQAHAPNFEVIIVDDGSREAAPECIRRWSRCFPLTIVRQAHAGVAAARNRGIQMSKGSVLVFVDADCRLQTNCLAALEAAILRSPQHRAFQLHLTGDGSSLVGRSEELRLGRLQHDLLQPDGCIRYLNTAGFALRRTETETHATLFDPDLPRGEDTLLLADLMVGGELPRFVASATVQHAVPLSVAKSFVKAVQCGYRSAKADGKIAARGVCIRMSHGERLAALASMWKVSAQPEIGRAAFGALVARQSLERITNFACQSFHVISRSRRQAEERSAHERRRASGGLALQEAAPAETRRLESLP